MIDVLYNIIKFYFEIIPHNWYFHKDKSLQKRWHTNPSLNLELNIFGSSTSSIDYLCIVTWSFYSRLTVRRCDWLWLGCNWGIICEIGYRFPI